MDPKYKFVGWLVIFITVISIPLFSAFSPAVGIIIALVGGGLAYFFFRSSPEDRTSALTKSLIASAVMLIVFVAATAFLLSLYAQIQEENEKLYGPSGEPALFPTINVHPVWSYVLVVGEILAFLFIPVISFFVENNNLKGRSNS